VNEFRETGASAGLRPWVQFVVLGIAIAAAATVVASFLIGGGTAVKLPAPNSGPSLVSQAQLEHLAAATAHPVYWAGPKPGFSYELTRTAGGRIYIRYLPKGVKAGDRRADFLVVGTYAQPGSFAYLKRASNDTHAVSLDLPAGGVAVYDAARPASVYFTYPRAAYQVEVYDPSGKAARRLVLAGKVIPLR
jgi:hypothetical protein